MYVFAPELWSAECQAIFLCLPLLRQVSSITFPIILVCRDISSSLLQDVKSNGPIYITRRSFTQRMVHEKIKRIRNVDAIIVTVAELGDKYMVEAGEQWQAVSTMSVEKDQFYLLKDE